ncbi:Bacterial type II/III secretion system short domain protein [Caulifigura coniformis]|uniref:Bacterial type II/III secretion system short domain protein n=1 Tax=Caulifigura coniformis TaxID=2527983 RepID=A0A517SFK6_9PLAN|nr:secretin N-terminal domain-containing protein [Caulifigura coniformis]QDT54913.1 Bacterial type II/III secretion system short domain protein [Caulifigura coniformis]
MKLTMIPLFVLALLISALRADETKTPVSTDVAPQTSTEPPAAQHAESRDDHWLTSISEGQVRAKETGRPLLIFWRTGETEAGGQMGRNLYSGMIRNVLRNVFVSVDADPGSETVPSTQLKITADPTVVVTDADLKELHRFEGLRSPEEIVAELYVAGSKLSPPRFTASTPLGMKSFYVKRESVTGLQKGDLADVALTYELQSTSGRELKSQLILERVPVADVVHGAPNDESPVKEGVRLLLTPAKADAMESVLNRSQISLTYRSPDQLARLKEEDFEARIAEVRKAAPLEESGESTDQQKAQPSVTENAGDAETPRPLRFVHYVSHGQRAMPVFTTLMEELAKQDVALGVGHPGEPPADQLRIEVTVDESGDWKGPVSGLLKEISELPVQRLALSCGPAQGKGETRVTLRWGEEAPKADVTAVRDLMQRQSRILVAFTGPVEVAPLPGAPAERGGLKIVRLSHAKAPAMAVLLSQVVMGPGFTAVADERTNSVVLKSHDAESLDAAEALLAKLDDAGPSPGKTTDLMAMGMGMGSEGDMSMGMGAPPRKAVSQLQKEYADREAAAAKLANELRGLQASSERGQPAEVRELSSDEFYAQAGSSLEGFIEKLHQTKLGRKPRQEEQAYWQGVLTTNGYDRVGLVRQFLDSVAPGKLDAEAGKGDPKQAALRKQLKDAVKKSFEARQAMLAAELEAMQAKLAVTRQSLEARNRISGEIVARRVEDLLNPALKWDEPQPASESYAASPQPAVSGPGRLPVDPNAPTGVRKLPSLATSGPQSRGPAGRSDASLQPAAALPYPPAASEAIPTPRLTGIWESHVEGMGMMGGMGGIPPYRGAGMSMMLAGEMSGAPRPRLVIEGEIAALYEKNERRRLWRMSVGRPGQIWTPITFTPLDELPAMQGSYATKDQVLTVVTATDEGPEIVSYHRSIAAVPPDWAKQMQADAGDKLRAAEDQFHPAARIDLSNAASAGGQDVLSKVAGLWTKLGNLGTDPAGMGMGGNPELGNAPQEYLVIHAHGAAVYEKNQRKQLWTISIDNSDETQARLTFRPVGGGVGMQGTYALKGGALSVVSVGEEGPKIVQYRRILPVTPPEWAAEISKLLPNRNLDLLRGVSSGEMRPGFTPAERDAKPRAASGQTTPSDQFLRDDVQYFPPAPLQRTAPKEDAVSDEFRQRNPGPRAERQPSDYLELLDRHHAALADYDKQLQNVGNDHPQTQQAQGGKARTLRSIDVIEIEFEAELDAAAGEVEVKQVELKAAKASLDRERKLFESNATTQTKVRQQESAARLAEARLKAAETRLRLFLSTREKLFPDKPDGPIAPTDPGTSPPVPPAAAPQPVPAQPGPAPAAPAASPSAPKTPAPMAPSTIPGPNA